MALRFPVKRNRTDEGVKKYSPPTEVIPPTPKVPIADLEEGETSGSGGSSPIPKKRRLRSDKDKDLWSDWAIPYSLAARRGGSATIGRGIEVRSSNIRGAGNGLFATRPFARNELITGMEGKLVDHATAMVMVDEGTGTHLKTLSRMWIHLDGIKDLVPTEGTAAASYANDGLVKELNNTAFFLKKNPSVGLPICYLKAKRAIESGEELLVSYGRDYWRYPAHRLKD